MKKYNCPQKCGVHDFLFDKIGCLWFIMMFERIGPKTEARSTPDSKTRKALTLVLS